MKVILVSILFILKIHNSFGSVDDQINSLPGLPQNVTFRQYSGYLNGGQDIRLHYWFVESQNNPINDPVILWLNGGPGASSLLGMLTENGPFRVNSDGMTLRYDPNSWNTLANVLYLESPVGVGYSYYNRSDTFNNTDDTTAVMNRLALEDFFRKFPHLKSNPFYITGESYAGVYIPTLAVEIFRSKSKINLKGLAIGNGAFEDSMLGESLIQLSLAHGLIDQDTYTEIMRDYCNCSTGVPKCDISQQDYFNLYRRIGVRPLNQTLINPYNVLSDCLPFNTTNSILLDNTLRMRFGSYSKSLIGIWQTQQAKSNCPKDMSGHYMNLPEVRSALHIPDQLKEWDAGADIQYQIQYQSMRGQFIQLNGMYKMANIIVYNGDLDLVCDFLGDQRFVDSLGYKAIAKYKPWKAVNGRIGGFVKRYEGITFTTVRGAGHMVPTDQPEAALEIIKELIGKTKLN